MFQSNDGAFGETVETAYGLVPLSQLTAYPDGTYSDLDARQGCGGQLGSVGGHDRSRSSAGLFADGFDAGTLTAWTGGTVPAAPGTRLLVQAAAASAGGFGLAVTGSGTTQATVQTPAVVAGGDAPITPGSRSTRTRSGRPAPPAAPASSPG